MQVAPRVTALAASLKQVVDTLIYGSSVTNYPPTMIQQSYYYEQLYSKGCKRVT